MLGGIGFSVCVCVCTCSAFKLTHPACYFPSICCQHLAFNQKRKNRYPSEGELDERKDRLGLQVLRVEKTLVWFKRMTV